MWEGLGDFEIEKKEEKTTYCHSTFIGEDLFKQYLTVQPLVGSSEIKWQFDTVGFLLV